MDGRVLILRRRAGEAILVGGQGGGEVEIEIVEISRSRVKLGVRAPAHVPVVRKETLPLACENRMASDLVARRGHEGVGELARQLNQPAPLPKADPSTAEFMLDSSTKSVTRRYESAERYSGYRRNRENPHPA